MRKRARVTLDRPRIALGLLAAALVGWALLVPLPFLAHVANELWWRPVWQTAPIIAPPSFGEAFAILILMSLVGLPLSFVFCFAVGATAWAVARWRGLRRLQDAALVGALVGAGLDLLLAAMKLVVVASGAPQQPEALSHLLLFYPGVALYVAAVGAIAGLAARWMSGTRSTVRDDMARVFA